MLIFPAIDLRDGGCVRLAQGDFSRQTDYAVTPHDQAESYANAGCQWVHVVDLDGARLGRPVHVDAVDSILALGRLKVQLGGGIRDEETARFWLNKGVERIVIGTAALRDAEFLKRLAQQWPGRIALGLDARDGKVATDGWKKTSRHRAVDIARKFDALELAAIIYTDIARDGVKAGPDVQGTAALADMTTTPIIASGGVRHLEDVQDLADVTPPLGGAIIGRALYEGDIDLRAAVRITATPSPKNASSKDKDISSKNTPSKNTPLKRDTSC